MGRLIELPEKNIDHTNVDTVDYSETAILQMLKELPDACCIFKVITDPFGTVRDMQFVC